MQGEVEVTMLPHKFDKASMLIMTELMTQMVLDPDLGLMHYV